MSRRCTAASAALLLLLSACEPDTTQSRAAVSFTMAQADQGRIVYTAHCASCHGLQLTGGNAPPLTGPQFRATWSSPDRSLGELFTLIQTTMPFGAEGSLGPNEYLVVMAYLLDRNGMSPGERALTADRSALARAHFANVSGAPLVEPGWNVRTVVPDFQQGKRGLAPRAVGPTQEELLAAEGNSKDWLTHTHDLSDTRYSGLTQIDPGNVSRLRTACTIRLGEAANLQTGPLVYRGTMYIATDWVTAAIDAATCRPKWRHEWRHTLGEIPSYRGAAIKDGRIVRGTSDGYLLALDAEDGELLWSRKIADPNRGERINMPPLIYDDLIYVGPAISENAIKGWIGAFRLEDGQRVWRFNIIPEPGEPGFETWAKPEQFPLGGGGVWTPLSVDIARGLLHVAASNPVPDFPAALRGGTNLYTNSALALELKTGNLVWYDQLVPADDHDWGLTQVSPLYSATIGGRKRDLMVTAGKDGMLRVIDRETKERMFETPVTTIENADAPVTNAGTHACPGVLGGVQWNGAAYHPGANVLVIPSVDWCSSFSTSSEIQFVPGQSYLGGTVRMDRTSRGWLTAVDASSGNVRWRYQSARPMVGAVTATAGGLIFAGELTGDLIALDAASGEVRFRQNTGGPVGGGIVSYEAAGRQYIAVASGRPSRFWASEREAGVARITVLALGDE